MHWAIRPNKLSLRESVLNRISEDIVEFPTETGRLRVSSGILYIPLLQERQGTSRT